MRHNHILEAFIESSFFEVLFHISVLKNPQTHVARRFSFQHCRLLLCHPSFGFLLTSVTFCEGLAAVSWINWDSHPHTESLQPKNCYAFLLSIVSFPNAGLVCEGMGVFSGGGVWPGGCWGPVRPELFTGSMFPLQCMDFPLGHCCCAFPKGASGRGSTAQHSQHHRSNSLSQLLVFPSWAMAACLSDVDSIISGKITLFPMSSNNGLSQRNVFAYYCNLWAKSTWLGYRQKAFFDISCAEVLCFS